jgi:hypothetical protein
MAGRILERAVETASDVVLALLGPVLAPVARAVARVNHRAGLSRRILDAADLAIVERNHHERSCARTTSSAH